MAAPAPEQALVEAAPERFDRITLTGITAYGHHGVFPAERQQGQPFVVDLTCELDLSAAAADDDLGQTVDYGSAGPGGRRRRGTGSAQPDRGAGREDRRNVPGRPGVQRVEVTVHKPQAPMPVPVADVAVSLTRSR